jgi:DNA-binding GntR family transcriptional regulator
MTTPAISLPRGSVRHDVSTLLSRGWELRVPKWVDVAEVIRTDIAAGRYQPGAVLHYAKLRETYGYGDASIRKAVLELESEGLVRRRHGVGVEVVAVPDGGPTPRTFGERLDDHERRLRALEEGR